LRGFLYTVCLGFSAINAKTLKVEFNKAVDTTKAVFDVKRGTVTETVTVTWNEAKTEASLARSSSFPAGTYTVTVTGVEFAEGKNTGSATVSAQALASIDIENTVLQKRTDAPLTVNFLDQYGDKMTIARSAATITAYNVTTSNTSRTVTPSATKFELDASAANVDDKINVTVVSGSKSVSKQLSVVTQAALDEVTLTETVMPTGKTRFTPAGTTNVEVKYTATNTLGEAYTLVAGDLQFISSDNTVLNPASVSISSKKIIISSFLKAGTVTLTALNPANGKSSSIEIVVEENEGAPYSLELAETTASYAAGTTGPVKVAVTVNDKYGTVIPAKDWGSTYTITSSNSSVVTSGNATTSPVTNPADADYGKLKITTEATATQGQSTVVTMTINATGQSASLTITASSAAVPTNVVTKKGLTVPTNMVVGAGSSITVIPQDQYGNAIGATTNYTIKYSSTDATKVSVTPTTGQALNASGVSATINAVAAGSATVKAQMLNGEVVVAEVLYPITVAEAGAEQLTYTIKDIPVLRGESTAVPALNNKYAYPVDVEAKDAQGNTYVVPASAIVNVTTSNSAVVRTPDKLGTDANLTRLQNKWAIAGADLAGTDATQKATITAYINTETGLKEVSKEVTVSKAAPAIQSVVLLDKAMDLTKNPYTFAEGTKEITQLQFSDRAALTAGADVYAYKVDQYGVYDKVAAIDNQTDVLTVADADKISGTIDGSNNFTITAADGTHKFQLVEASAGNIKYKANSAIKFLVKDANGSSAFKLLTVTIAAEEPPTLISANTGTIGTAAAGKVSASETAIFTFSEALSAASKTAIENVVKAAFDGAKGSAGWAAAASATQGGIAWSAGDTVLTMTATSGVFTAFAHPAVTFNKTDIIDAIGNAAGTSGTVSATLIADVTSPAYTLVGANNTVTVTLTGGTFKAGAIAATDFTFAGTDAAALAAGTFVRTSDTVVTITIAAGCTGADNTVLVKAATQAKQATSVLAAGSTV